MTARASLRLVKTLHTVVWAFFVGCIVALPAAALAGRFDLALVSAGLVLGEVAVLATNGWRCPLTAVAARYTDDRRDNVDIYLRLWLARTNKDVSGAPFVAGLLVTLALWTPRA